MNYSNIFQNLLGFLNYGFLGFSLALVVFITLFLIYSHKNSAKIQSSDLSETDKIRIIVKENNNRRLCIILVFISVFSSIYFQVTDPYAQITISVDPIEERPWPKVRHKGLLQTLGDRGEKSLIVRAADPISINYHELIKNPQNCKGGTDNAVNRMRELLSANPGGWR